MESRELMGYITKLENKKILEEETKKDIENLIDKLNLFKHQTDFVYNQMTKLRNDLKKDPIGDDLYSDSLFIPKLQSYFDLNDNFVSLMNEQTDLLYNSFEKLIDFINSIKDDLDARKLKDMEIQETIEEESKKKENKKKSEVQNGEELLEEDLEEDEEIAVNVNRYLFECENCGDKSPNSYIGGCRKCGENNIKVEYL